jgi:hypothetical protein
VDSGTTWQPWEGDPNLRATYPGGVQTLSNQTGDWGFTLPWTDSSSEIQLPGGGPLPGLLWNIIDPNPTTGVRVIYGATPQSIVGATKTTKQLISLAAPSTWQVGSVAYFATPIGQRRYVTVVFTSSNTTAALVFPAMATASWRCAFGCSSDDTTKTYAAIVDSTTKTETGATIHLSDVPPSGKTVWVDVEVY